MSHVVRAAGAAALLLLVLAACAQPYPRQVAGAIGECDRLAGDRFDPNRAAPGVMFHSIDAEAAVPACRAAVAQAPEEPRLRYQLGRALDNAEDYHAALAAYQAAGAYAPALAGVGYLHDEGLGVPQDLALALDLYRRSLDGGYALAASFLGYMYEHGRGVAQDDAEAARLYHEAAAKTGDPYTQTNLGYLYETGRGVRQDHAEAVRYYRLAADQGHALAQNNLGAMYAGGWGVPEDDVEAVRLYRLAAAQEEPLAWRNLGDAYLYGHGTAADPVEAAAWYEKAIATEDAGAMNALAWMWALRGERLDEALALAERAVAAEPGNADFQDTLAWVHHRRGDHRAALAAQQQVVARNAESAPFWARLGDILAALGRAGEARAAWQRALALPDPDDPAATGWDRAAVEARLGQG